MALPCDYVRGHDDVDTTKLLNDEVVMVVSIDEQPEDVDSNNTFELPMLAALQVMVAIDLKKVCQLP